MKTAESVSPRHLDKLCDQISDAILDACLEQDPMSRVAIETLGSHGVIKVAGELTTKAYVDIPKIVRSVMGEDYKGGVEVNIRSQSPEIAQGVDVGGAGDQGICVGYACRDNPALIPQELYLARSLCQYLFAQFPFDGKTQITLNEEGKIKTVVASFQNVKKEKLEHAVREWVTDGEDDNLEGKKILCNPAGDWNIGGFDADTGLTGRKIVVDAYGPQVPVGGGCFSGKDATKIDRSGAYMARKIAVELLRGRETAYEVMVKLAYAIGVAEPVMAVATIDGAEFTIVNYDLTPETIIKKLNLRTPQFQKTAEWGAFGNGFTWDK